MTDNTDGGIYSNVVRKLPGYTYQEYPKMVGIGADGNPKIVRNQNEELKWIGETNGGQAFEPSALEMERDSLAKQNASLLQAREEERKAREEEVRKAKEEAAAELERAKKDAEAKAKSEAEARAKADVEAAEKRANDAAAKSKADAAERDALQKQLAAMQAKLDSNKK